MAYKTFAKQLRASQTKAETKLWNLLRAKRFRGLKFKRQAVIGDYIVDFVCFERKVIIELDGEKHNNLNKKIYDEERTNWLKTQGFSIVRFWNTDFLKNSADCLEIIRRITFKN